MTDTGRALVQAILAAPEDDTPRLILADHLDDCGEADRAEFVRIGCELARPSRCQWRDRSQTPGRGHMDLVDCPDYNAARPPYRILVWCPACQRRENLKARDQELRNRLTIPLWDGEQPGEANGIGAFHRRGFPAEIVCDLARWLVRGPAIVQANPIEGVTITDRQPYRTSEDGVASWFWYHDHWILPSGVPVLQHAIPPDLWLVDEPDMSEQFAREFPSEPAAQDWLSGQCLRWARKALVEADS